MIEDKELDALLTTFQPAEPTDSAEFMTEFEKRLMPLTLPLPTIRQRWRRRRRGLHMLLRQAL